MFRILVVCCLSFFVTMSDAGVAPFIVPCKLDDKACLISSSQAAVATITAGIPEFGVEKLDPINLQTITADTDKLQLLFNNVDVSGLSKCKILSVEINDDQSKLSLVLETPFVATGQYVTKGELVVHVEGSGDFKLETEKIELTIQAVLATTVGSDGQKHWQIDSFDFTFDPKEKIHMKFENIYDGDEEKATALHVILDNSWKEMAGNFGKPIITQFIEKIRIFINNFFKAVTLNELHKS